MADTEQAGWAAAALVAVTTIVKSAFGRSARRDDVIVKLLNDCEKRHDERDVKYAQLEQEVRRVAVEHAACPGKIEFLQRRVNRLEKGLTPVHGTQMVAPERTGVRATPRESADGTILPPPIMHESVGGHER